MPVLCRFIPRHDRKHVNDCRAATGSSRGVQRKDDGIKSATTIYQVAKAAGVHPSAVSRALGTNSRVSDATRPHIKNVAAQLGYRA
ncbi:LacI family DNA-binding transcriptional regulator [Arthrobacter sp. D1-17]